MSEAAKRLVIGIGCTRGAPRGFVEQCIRRTLRQHGLELRHVRTLATLDRKRDEPALQALAAAHGWTLVSYEAPELDAIAAVGSAVTREHVGANAVAEPAACLAASPGARLLVPKTIYRDEEGGHALTLAVACEEAGERHG